MKDFELYVAYIDWGDGGKKRPILVLRKVDKTYAVYNITTQYSGKSPEIRAKYFKIDDWAYAGLHYQSYIDTNDLNYIDDYILDKKYPIGELSENDKKRLLKFLNGAEDE